MAFDWSQAAALLSDFGGQAVELVVAKSGLPFFDALQLYGAIDLYIGTREDIFVRDDGCEWYILANRRLEKVRVEMSNCLEVRPLN